MSVVETIHGRYIHDRRSRILSRRLADIIPENFSVLDVGCGDGFLTQLISQVRPDISLMGSDVLVRDRTHIPVNEYDGRTIPYDDASFDGVMFLDVLHHSTDPLSMLREGLRVARKSIVIKDHLCEGLFADLTLRVMDRVGNARHGVSPPYNYWPKQRWIEAFDALGLRIEGWTTQLGIYPWPASWVFDRSLHFIARLGVALPR
jgi:SAM-dependent methyltransferase